MKLQRQYTDGACSHVRVIHSGSTPEQNFSCRLVAAGVAQGWISISGNQLLMKTDAEPLRYHIKGRPGYYCRSSGESIPVTPAAWRLVERYGITEEARPELVVWLLAHGKAASDYRLSLQFDCVLDADQHNKHKAGA
jgi:hypothetical protein